MSVGSDRIAIVGMACRYPDASTPQELWQNVLAQRRAFRRIPERRLSAAYRSPAGSPDSTYATHAAVLRDWEFDRARFGVPGPLYRAADHTHWLALETAAAALADAGFAGGGGLERDTAGVILGNSLAGEFSRAGMLRLRWPFLADAAATALATAGAPAELTRDVLGRLETLVKEPFQVPSDETLSGALANTIAGRICNHFDFHGTGFTIDGACSSSLLAVTAACRALVAGECDFMLAGGVDMSLDPLELVGFSRLGALAEGDMRVYDAAPTGFLPGEGCGVVALMRAADADAAGLRSYAHIVGWASSSDGSGGLTRPERSGQALALRRAYQAAGLRPGQIGLIEGHGTGTPIGDRVELEALISVRGENAEPAALGSVKANIGHTKAAAGAAGLIKAALATHHRVLPPITGCERPHELLGDGATPLRVLHDPEPWTDEVARAGVSSMGFGGINVHVVIEGTGTKSTAAALPADTKHWSARCGRHEIVLVSAEDRARLAERLGKLAETATALSVAEVRDVAATAWHRRGDDQPWRAALVATTPDELASAARTAARAAADRDGGPRFDQRDGYALGSAEPLRVGLLFPGQAAPIRAELPWWAGRLGVPALPADVAVRAESVGTESAQPAIVRQSLAALAWFDALGCTAVGATAHSLGEITGLCWSGACTADAALGLAAVRGKLMAQHGIGGTAMAGVAASTASVERLLAGTDAVIACLNGPEQVVVAGPKPDVATVIDRAEADGISASLLPVSHAFHSPAMQPVVEPLRRALAGFDLGGHSRRLFSTITGRALTDAGDELRELLVEQLTRPVRFAEAVTELASRCDILVELGPGAILAGLAEPNGVGVPAVSLDSGGDPRRHAFVTALLAACAGADLGPWFADRPHRELTLDAVPVFVTNPCENREGWADAATLAGTRIAAPARTQEASSDAGTAGAASTDDPLVALTMHLAAMLELPAASIAPASSLLGDLHMTSLQVVEAVGAVATGLGKAPPSTPLSLSDATVAEAADVLGDLPATGAEGAADVPAGVRGWVRQFESRWVAFTPDPVRAASIRWRVDAPAGHWLHGLADGRAEGTEPLGVHAVGLAAGAGAAEVAQLLGRIRRREPSHLVLVHNGHPAAAGIARSVAAELTSCRVVVLDIPDEAQQVALDELIGPHAEDYLELRALPSGALERSVLRPRPPSAREPAALDAVNLAGVILVTGGVRGITAYSAVELAERTGSIPVFLGRTPEDDPDVNAMLHDLVGQAHYISCDVTDPASVKTMLARAKEHGPIRGLIHGAGVNEPRRIADITPESFERTLAPKVDGLRNLLAALDTSGEELRLLLGFGSIIGRQGLDGQAEYCIANDWLRADIQAWAHSHPGCRTHLLEWSVWSGVGMGVRLGVLDNLRRLGVEPIGPRHGVDALLDVLADPEAPVTVLITARFPTTATTHIEGLATPLLRFGEHVRAHLPGVEVVVESELSLGSDPYLDDHRIDGTPVLPAVVAMEAMAQAAAQVDPPSAGASQWSLADLEFHAPITLSGPHPRTLRVAALVERDGIDVVLRDDSDAFSTDRFTGSVVPAPPLPERASGGKFPEVPRNTAEPHEFYGTTFFHSGRFRRLVRYDLLTAFRVRAWIHAEPAGPGLPWFSEFHSDQLLLGDPGAHDATLHVLLACIPHRRALPVGVDRVTVWRKPAGVLRVDAVEVSHTADDYVFDVDLTEPDGSAVARWQGLRLRSITPPQCLDTLPESLVGPWLSRRLIESGFADRIELVTAPGTRRSGDAVDLLRQIAGAAAGHDPAGGLHVNGHRASASYARGRLLLAVADDPVGVDWESVPDGPTRAGAVPCVPADHNVAELLADKLGEEPMLARLRVWSAREALAKLGYDHSEPLRVDRIAEDGLTALRSGGEQVVTALVRTGDADVAQIKVAAVACGRER